MSKNRNEDKCTVKFTVLYRDYVDQGKEFKPGLGIGVFASQEYTYALKPGQFESPLFQMSLHDQKRVILDELFLVKSDLVDASSGEPVANENTETPRSVMAILFKRYRDICEAAVNVKQDAHTNTLNKSDLYMQIGKCSTALELLESLPIDKLGRTLGRVQGVLAACGLISLEEEELLSETMFMKAYKNAGYSVGS